MAAAGIAATVALGLLLGGCLSESYQRGYIVPDGALEQIPIGSTQEQVLIVLGTPSTVATVSGEAFYYISQRSERPISAWSPSISTRLAAWSVWPITASRMAGCSTS
jgi:outer membrane protein assembly factor BamE (lipoprotein component of BamABCDE complex)